MLVERPVEVCDAVAEHDIAVVNPGRSKSTVCPRMDREDLNAIVTREDVRGTVREPELMLETGADDGLVEVCLPCCIDAKYDERGEQQRRC